MIEIPHIAFPLRQAADGTLAAVEQDSLDDVRQCVHVLLRTPLGARPLAPDTGVEDPTFSQGVDPDELATRLAGEDNEPRAELTITARPVGATGDQQLRITVGLAGDIDQTSELT